MSKRTTVTLEPTDESAVASFTDPTRTEHEVLADWAVRHGLTVTEQSSEATIIRALLRAGAEALQEQALDRGYAALAASFTDEERDEARIMRRRYAERSDSQFPA